MGIHPDRITVPPWAILGYRADGRPIRPLAGGAEDPDPDPEDDPEPEEDPAPEDDPKPDPDPAPKSKSPAAPDDEDYVPTPAEWKRTREALKKANSDAKRNRERARELEEKGRATETDHEKALREAREDGEKRYRAPLVRTAARGALVEAGALGFLADEKDPESREAKDKGEARLKRLLRLIDTDGLDVDEDGTVSGLEAAVDELRRDYPELFAAAARKSRPRPTGAPRPPAPDKPKASWEQHAARALGKT